MDNPHRQRPSDLVDALEDLPPYKEDEENGVENLLESPSGESVTSATSNSSVLDDRTDSGDMPSFTRHRRLRPHRSMSLPLSTVRDAPGGRRRSSSMSDQLSRSRPLKPRYAILIMGMTGAGKSSFIAAATGRQVEVGHTLEPCTSEPRAYDMISKSGVSVSLIDTPGFNDLRKNDMDVLQSILTFITQASIKQRIIAVLYLHRIVDKKITGSSELNLRMLRALAGEHFFQSTGIVTSMWGSIPRGGMQGALQREEELSSDDGDFWGDMCRKGVKYQRWDERLKKHYVSAKSVVDTWVDAYENRPTTAKLQVLLELDKGASTEETSAGKILTEELRKRQERELRQLQEEEEERGLLEEQARSLQARMKDAQDGIKREAELAAKGSRRSDRLLGRSSSMLPDALIRRNRDDIEDEEVAEPRSHRRPSRLHNRRSSVDEDNEGDLGRRTTRDSRRRPSGSATRSRWGLW